MLLTFLGTGTSTGVPQPRCTCEVCTSKDPRDNRLRCSVLIEDHGKRLLIDCGPDFRYQMIREGHQDRKLDALLLTHHHYDHTGGIDDLRPYYRDHENGFPIYCRSDVERTLRRRLPYCFPDHLYPGAPVLELRHMSTGSPVEIAGFTVLPLMVFHGDLPILGFRIGKLGYITDCKIMPEETVEALKGVDTLVINALFDNRENNREHPTHMNLTQALDIISRISPRHTYLIHMGHKIGLHEVVNPTLPQGVELAYDGLTVEI